MTATRQGRHQLSVSMLREGMSVAAGNMVMAIASLQTALLVKVFFSLYYSAVVHLSEIWTCVCFTGSLWVCMSLCVCLICVCDTHHHLSQIVFPIKTWMSVQKGATSAPCCV